MVNAPLSALAVVLMCSIASVADRTFEPVSVLSANHQQAFPDSVLPSNSLFGSSIASLAASENMANVLIGAPGDLDDTGAAVWLVVENGAITAYNRMANGQGGMSSGSLHFGSRFGCSMTVLRPSIGGGAITVLVGADSASPLAQFARPGAIFVVTLSPWNSAASASSIVPGLAANLPASVVSSRAAFGASMATIDNNCSALVGTCRVAVGAPQDETRTRFGSIVIVSFDSSNIVVDYSKITPGSSGLALMAFSTLPGYGETIGWSMAVVHRAQPNSSHTGAGIMIRLGNSSSQTASLLLWLNETSHVYSCGPVLDLAGLPLTAGQLSTVSHRNATIGMQISDTVAVVANLNVSLVQAAAMGATANTTNSAGVTCASAIHPVQISSIAHVGAGYGLPQVAVTAGFGAAMAVSDDGQLLFVGDTQSQQGETGRVVVFNNSAVANASSTVATHIGTFQIGQYSNGLDFSQTFTSSSGSGLRIRCLRLSTESCCDYVRAYAGTSTVGPLMFRASGGSCPADISTFGSVTLRFSSDSSVIGSGFEFQIDQIPAAQLALPSPSGTPSPTASPSGSMTPTPTVTPTTTPSVNAYPTAVAFISSLTSSTTFQYGSYVNFLTYERVFAPSGAVTSLRVACTSINTESCCDKVRVYSGTSTSSGSLLATYSGSSCASSTVTHAGPVLLRFTSDQSIIGQGFSFTVTATNASPSPTATPTPVLPTPSPRSGSTVVVSAGSPQTFSIGSYSNNARVTIDYTVSQPGFVLRVQCVRVATESCCDRATIYDRGTSSGSGTSLTTYKGSSCGSAVITESGRLRIYFTSDSSVTGAGLELRITAVNASDGSILASPSSTTVPAPSADFNFGTIAGVAGGIFGVVMLVAAIRRCNSAQNSSRRRDIIAAAAAAAQSRATAAAASRAASQPPKPKSGGGAVAARPQNPPTASTPKPEAFSLSAHGAAAGPPPGVMPAYTYAGAAGAGTGYGASSLPPMLASGPLAGGAASPAQMPRSGLPGLPVASVPATTSQPTTGFSVPAYPSSSAAYAGGGGFAL